jgi:hypothetical protein
MNGAVGYLLIEGSVNQLLLLHRAQALKYSPDRHDIVVVALSLDMEFTLTQVVLQ